MTQTELLNTIRKEIERRKIAYRSSDNLQDAIRYDEITDLLAFLDTLPEQPVKGLDVTDFCKPVEPGIAKRIADHWWELLDDENATDKNAVKEIVKTTRKEVTRQVKEMVKEQPAGDGLEEEIKQYFDGWSDDTEYGQAVTGKGVCVGVEDCEDFARHFAEWGAKNAK